MEPTIESFKKTRKGGHPPTSRVAREQKIEEDFIKMLKSLSKLFISSTLLCAMIMLNAQGQHARSLRSSSGPSAGTHAILCMPGFVLKCNQFRCVCVEP
jgi:hypothetical protein